MQVAFKHNLYAVKSKSDIKMRHHEVARKEDYITESRPLLTVMYIVFSINYL